MYLKIKNKKKVLCKNFQTDYVSLIFHTFGNQISALQAELNEQKQVQGKLNDKVEELTYTLSKQNNYVKSLEKTIMSIIR
jgi:uncharacterized phage infection (PIP) family protein YhgE